MLLYLDNIRGFNNQVIDLNDVNFLVGENSTGKTTVLAILHFFSEGSTDFFTDFKSEFVDFGPFKEIINSNSSGKKFFYVGFFAREKDILAGQSGHFLMRFYDNNGFADADQFIWLDEGLCIRFEKLAKSISFSYLENVPDLLDISDFKALSEIPFPKKNTIQDIGESVLSTDSRLSPDLIGNIYVFGSDLKIPRRISNKCRQFFRGNERSILPDFVWIDPIRTKPQRIYEPRRQEYSPDGNHTPTLLRNLFTGGGRVSKRIIGKLESFGLKTGLFDSIVIDQYRTTKDSPFSVNVKLKDKILRITNVGYGVSQILPILAEILVRAEGGFLIQQPEVHLHPKSQASFGDFVFSEFTEAEKSFIIETHSDFIIDRFRSKLRQHKNRKKLIAKTNILFFERVNGQNKVTKIPLDDNADYGADQPKAFREFFLREQMLNLGME